MAAIRICMNRLSPVGQHNPVAFELPAHPLAAGLPARHVRHPDRHRQRRYCTLRGYADRQADRLRFVEALNTPVVAPVMCLFGGRRDLLFVNPSK